MYYKLYIYYIIYYTGFINGSTLLIPLRSQEQPNNKAVNKQNTTMNIITDSKATTK